jgi:hypothetical protein
MRHEMCPASVVRIKPTQSISSCNDLRESHVNDVQYIGAIFITARSGDPMQQVESVQAVGGKGLAGDRKYRDPSHPGGSLTPTTHPIPFLPDS